MTIDEVATAMRQRFTEKPAGPVEITVEEWNAMADATYLRDALAEIRATPDNDRAIAKAERMLAKHRRV